MKIFETGIKNWILDGKETHVQFRVRQTSIFYAKMKLSRILYLLKLSQVKQEYLVELQ